MKTGTVLVVDDEASIRQLVSFIIEGKTDKLPTEAMNGEAALVLARASKPDLVILDVKMPGTIDGYDVARELRADSRTRHIPILMLSALHTPFERAWGLEQGADAFLRKPFDPKELAQLVTTLTAKQSTPRPAAVGLAWEALAR